MGARVAFFFGFDSGFVFGFLLAAIADVGGETDALVGEAVAVSVGAAGVALCLLDRCDLLPPGLPAVPARTLPSSAAGRDGDAFGDGDARFLGGVVIFPDADSLPNPLPVAAADFFSRFFFFPFPRPERSSSPALPAVSSLLESRKSSTHFIIESAFRPLLPPVHI